MSDDDEIKIVLSHISDHRKLWAEWMKVMSKDTRAPARHDFGKASVKLKGEFARLSDGDIQLHFKKEKGVWKFTVKAIEPDLQKLEEGEQGGAKKSGSSGASKPKSEGKGVRR